MGYLSWNVKGTWWRTRGWRNGQDQPVENLSCIFMWLSPSVLARWDSTKEQKRHNPICILESLILQWHHEWLAWILSGITSTQWVVAMCVWGIWRLLEIEWETSFAWKQILKILRKQSPQSLLKAGEKEEIILEWHMLVEGLIAGSIWYHSLK